MAYEFTNGCMSYAVNTMYGVHELLHELVHKVTHEAVHNTLFILTHNKVCEQFANLCEGSWTWWNFFIAKCHIWNVFVGKAYSGLSVRNWNKSCDVYLIISAVFMTILISDISKKPFSFLSLSMKIHHVIIPSCQILDTPKTTHTCVQSIDAFSVWQVKLCKEKHPILLTSSTSNIKFLKIVQFKHWYIYFYPNAWEDQRKQLGDN